MSSARIPLPPLMSSPSKMIGFQARPVLLPWLAGPFRVQRGSQAPTTRSRLTR
jgi:hypothetical protein